VRWSNQCFEQEVAMIRTLVCPRSHADAASVNYLGWSNPRTVGRKSGGEVLVLKQTVQTARRRRKARARPVRKTSAGVWLGMGVLPMVRQEQRGLESRGASDLGWHRCSLVHSKRLPQSALLSQLKRHTPSWQVPAEQTVPSVLFGLEQVPEAESHEPTSWHSSSAAHVTGFAPVHVPD
jgi:hypothetical protein